MSVDLPAQGDGSLSWGPDLRPRTRAKIHPWPSQTKSITKGAVPIYGVALANPARARTSLTRASDGAIDARSNSDNIRVRARWPPRSQWLVQRLRLRVIDDSAGIESSRRSLNGVRPSRHSAQAGSTPSQAVGHVVLSLAVQSDHHLTQAQSVGQGALTVSLPQWLGLCQCDRVQVIMMMMQFKKNLFQAESKSCYSNFRVFWGPQSHSR